MAFLHTDLSRDANGPSLKCQCNGHLFMIGFVGDMQSDDTIPIAHFRKTLNSHSLNTLLTLWYSRREAKHRQEPGTNRAWGFGIENKPEPTWWDIEAPQEEIDE